MDIRRKIKKYGFLGLFIKIIYIYNDQSKPNFLSATLGQPEQTNNLHTGSSGIFLMGHL